MKPVEFDEAPLKAVSADGIQMENTNTISGGSEITISDDRACQSDSIIEGFPRMGSSKAFLHEICAANHWDPPVFDCCKEEGPNHMKLFTFKVTVKIAEPSVTVLECFGTPKSKKKTAAEHAAEGALWCIQNLGYHSKHK
ncbi:hypothetical protein F0562_023120 [Nyssa sinensis]|uniref:DRBM domain-containing protein n=1 Tax=Nyssa sinensis TaxID=561372 RepID=A0A5J5BH68_9ASTE|nr:hypothetical protein F0562_023120 [Nyssa sinensis]